MEHPDIEEGMSRRQFVCKSAMICAFMPLLGPGTITGRTNQSTDGENKMNPMELTTYCGLYCGACDIYQKRIGDSGRELKKVLGAYKFEQYAHMIPGLEEYGAFTTVLDNMIQMFGQCPGCQGGGGDPGCKIRLCAKEKGYASCVECADVPCDLFANFIEFNPGIKDELARIKKVGLEAWSKEMQEKVDSGFRNSDVLL